MKTIKTNKKICSVCKRIVKLPIEWWNSVNACSECVKKAAIELQERNIKTNEKWEEEFDDKFLSDIRTGNEQIGFWWELNTNNPDDIKDFISKLLQKERHDNEILVNTILDTKKRELQDYKQSLKKRIKKKLYKKVEGKIWDLTNKGKDFEIAELVKNEIIKLIDKKNE